MRSSFTAVHGLKLARTPNAREEARRRRLLAVCAIAGLALASGIFGVVTAPPHRGEPPAMGPFSYFPSE